MLVGAASVFAWHNLVKPLGGWFGVYELLPAFVFACIAIVVVSLLTKSLPRKSSTSLTLIWISMCSEV